MGPRGSLLLLCLTLVTVCRAGPPAKAPFCRAGSSKKLQLSSDNVVKTPHMKYPSFELRTLSSRNRPIDDSLPPLTLVTVLTRSGNRLQHLKLLLDGWKGTVSVAMSLCSLGDVGVVQAFVDSLTPTQSRQLHLRFLVEDGSLYVGANSLRNVAMAAAPTNWAFVVEADVLLSGPVTSYWLDLSQSHAATAAEPVTSDQSPRTLYFLPALESTGAPARGMVDKDGYIPKPLAHALFKRGELAVTNASLPALNSILSTEQWFQLDDSKLVPYTEHFEPYYIVQKPFPQFPNQFPGRGWHAVGMYFSLWADGWKLRTLARSLVVVNGPVEAPGEPNDPWDSAAKLRMAILYSLKAEKAGLECGENVHCDWKVWGDTWLKQRAISAGTNKSPDAHGMDPLKWAETLKLAAESHSDYQQGQQDQTPKELEAAGGQLQQQESRTDLTTATSPSLRG